MRVAFVAFDSSELSVRLASALADHAEVRLILPDEQTRPYLKWLSPRVDYRPFTRPRLRRPLKQVATIARVLSSIRAFRPDVVHFQKWHLWFFLALPLLRRYPLVISIHDPRPHLGDKGARKTPVPIIDFGYRQADRVIAHNEQMRDEITELVGIDRDRIDLVPLVERGDDSLAVGVEERGNEILFFGRIWAYKGLANLIRAEPRISEAVPDLRIVVAGRGDDLEPYRRMMAHPERFEIHDEYVSTEKQAELFRRASVVVLPYVEATQSGVIPVAYTFSRPVIATSVGGLPAQVDDGVTGLLVPPEDEAALAAAVISLMQDPDRRRRMGENGRRKLVEQWSAEAVARKTMEVYERTIEQAGGHPSPAPSLHTGGSP